MMGLCCLYTTPKPTMKTEDFPSTARREAASTVRWIKTMYKEAFQVKIIEFDYLTKKQIFTTCQYAHREGSMKRKWINNLIIAGPD